VYDGVAPSLSVEPLDDAVEDAAVVGSAAVVSAVAVTAAAAVLAVVALEDAALARPAAPRVMPMPARPA
jgi:hypothetical protein